MICIFLCAPFFINAQIQKGDSLFAKGDWLAARVAYERELFLGVNSSEVFNTLLLKKSYSFKAEGNFDAAYQTLSRALLYEGSDSLRFLLFYELSFNAFLAEKPDLAIGHIQEFNYNFEGSEFDDELLFLEILCLNKLKRWREAKEKYERYATVNDLNADVNQYEEILNHKFKNPKKAQNLSLVIPGSGQMYAGFPLKGLFSLTVQAGLVYFSVESFLNAYYLSGVFTGVALFYMFYNGGARYAAKLATQNNEKVVQSFNDKISTIIIENELIKKGG